MPKGKKGFQPGQSGNPKGRPKDKKAIAGVLRLIGDEKIDTKGGTITKLEAVMRTVYKHAALGEAWAINFIADRTEGKPKQTIEQDIIGDVPDIYYNVRPPKKETED